LVLGSHACGYGIVRPETAVEIHVNAV